MSWSSLANNQIVSDSNLSDAVATGVFAAKTSIPLTERELTTTAATDYAYLSVTAGRTSNQLVTKNSLSASYVGTGPYNYYVYGVDGNYIYQSTNGGFTFAPYTALPFQGPNVYTCVAANSTGQFLITAANTINNTYWVSQDYGATFVSHNCSNIGGNFPTFYPLNVDVSSDGRYMAIVGKASFGTTLDYGTIAISTDYGSTFTINRTNTVNYNITDASVTVSGDGSHISYVAYNASTQNSFRFISIDYGTSFRYYGLSTNQIFTDIASSNTGQYQCITNYGTASSGNFFVSQDYGGSFQSRSTQGEGKYCGITSNGAIMQISTTNNNNGSVFYSTNNGVNWSIYSYNSTQFERINGMAVGTIFQVPSISNYLAVFNYVQLTTALNYCTYKSSGSTGTNATFYAQPLTYGFTMNKIYKRAYNY
jgi:hypothetical protein